MLTKSKNPTIRKQAKLELATLQTSKAVVTAPTIAPAKTEGTFVPSSFNYQMNQYYSLKKRKPRAAERLLSRILRRYPNKLMAIKEMAYTKLANEQGKQALHYFLKWQRFEPSNDRVKLQIAYIYDRLGLHKEAYQQFKIVSKSKNPKLAEIACQALVNLAHYKYKILPNPWFADLYYAPIWRGRFRNLIHPVKFRFGAALGKHKQFQVYGFVRYTRDVRSAGGTIPDIFEDNAAIFGVGASVRPFVKIPIFIYLEGGRAYDLIDRNRGRWRRDVRGGVMGYQRWGRGYACNSCLRFPFKPVGDFYGDISFFSRYDNNIIGQLRLRQGLRVLEWGNSSVDVYLKGQYFFDRKHEFYNNVLEFGPGISFVPYNRFPFAIRVERIRAQYLHVNSPTPIPYGNHHYFETRVEAEFYLHV